MAESEEELKSFLMRVKEDSEKAVLKLKRFKRLRLWHLVSSLHGKYEDPLEKEMATYSSILAWKIPWTEEPDRLQSIGRKESNKTGTTENTHMHNKQTRNNSETNLEAIAAV